LQLIEDLHGSPVAAVLKAPLPDLLADGGLRPPGPPPTPRPSGPEVPSPPWFRAASKKMKLQHMVIVFTLW